LDLLDSIDYYQIISNYIW